VGVSPKLGGNPVDIGPVMSDSRSQSSANPFAALESALPIVLADPNVDCATVAFSTGQQLAPLFPLVLGMLDGAARGGGKPVNVWIYGTSLAAMQELACRLQERGLPSYLDLDIAIKALGAAARYSEFRSDMS
jgi:acyl-CoA synthetase (NDP forming)